jgi:hypothetical protein
MAIDTRKFWEFVKDYKGTASIKDVYAQFEKESSLDSFESKIVWASINSDLQDYFTKTAKTTIAPDGTITIDNESPEPEHHAPIEPKTDLSPLPEASDHSPSPSTSLAPHASPTETTPEPTSPPPSNPPQNKQSPSNDGTVFDRLKEKS